MVCGVWSRGVGTEGVGSMGKPWARLSPKLRVAASQCMLEAHCSNTPRRWGVEQYVRRYPLVLLKVACRHLLAALSRVGARVPATRIWPIYKA